MSNYDMGWAGRMYRLSRRKQCSKPDQRSPAYSAAYYSPKFQGNPSFDCELTSMSPDDLRRWRGRRSSCCGGGSAPARCRNPRTGSGGTDLFCRCNRVRLDELSDPCALQVRGGTLPLL
ncbi:unnamed protein product [Cuscuta europaea]|uniref:Uncharacterized protein n=1 Tax=Cuscuta europaea TaxID=41803 RepID=A0A9P0ZQM1_CUSEU|nr:unnamed protein product [Cuscuta europaea]